MLNGTLNIPDFIRKLKICYNDLRSDNLVYSMQTKPGAEQVVEGNLLPQIPALDTGFNLELPIREANPSGDAE
jgi:hypothetical protein